MTRAFLALTVLTSLLIALATQADTIVHAGRTREYLVHLPPGFSKDKHCPVILAFHGGGGRGSKFQELTHIFEASDSKSFVVVTPEGIDHHWEDGRPERGAKVDDIGFIDELIEKLQKDYGVDPTKVFATGISNGGLFSFALACARSEKISGIAVVSMNMGDELAKNCPLTRKIPVMIFSGNKDPLVPFDGGNIRGPFGFKKLGLVMSSQASFEFWKLRLGCNGKTQETSFGEDSKDGTKVTKQVLDPCEQNSKLVRYLIDGGGHTWPGGNQYLREWVIGKTSRDVNASSEIVDFFSQIKNQLK